MKQSLWVKRAQRGWFAAGAGTGRALGELSDAPFKVFVHVRLRAERTSGCLEFRRQELARVGGQAGVGAGGGSQPARRLLAAGAPQVLAPPSAGGARREAGAGAEGRPGDG